MTGFRPKLSLIAVAVAVMVAGCGERDIGLRELRNASEGPEEFGIVPVKPLEIPESLSALPQPTPGGGNRSDQSPEADAIAALGGNPNRTLPTGAISGNDSALVAQATRFGVDPTIREQLAAADLEFRRRRSRFTWKLFPEDEYVNAYRGFLLDGYVEMERFRRAGVRTPAAPPEGYIQQQRLIAR